MEEIYKRITELSPHVQTQEAYDKLVGLTHELLELYNNQGRLDHDPFSPTRKRILGLPQEQIQHELKDCTCIVTGGLGCVGTILVKELLKFDVKEIIILDNNRGSDPFESSERVSLVYCDIRDERHVEEIFSQCRPDLVFHTAAQRDPGFAETHIEESVRTNVLGTLNIVKASELIGTVKQLVFSSTGKASRYFTDEVYAASKKMCEFILDVYARKSAIKYSMVRFTHILDNSLMNAELEERSRNNDYVSIHCPGKYVIAQNAREAAHLMLNALVYSEKKQCQFLTVRHLEWPVESLEMALYHIKQSGRKIPIIFVGNPIGYSEKFFRGQMDWSRPNDLNLLINVYEQEYRKLNPAEDIIIARITPPNSAILHRILTKIEKVHGERETRLVLLDGLKELVRDTLKNVNKRRTVDILKWGLDPQCLETEHIQVSDFGAIVPLLIQSLEGSRYYREVINLTYYGTVSKSMIGLEGVAKKLNLAAGKLAKHADLTLPRLLNLKPI